jgi:hypothetical protein
VAVDLKAKEAVERATHPRESIEDACDLPGGLCATVQPTASLRDHGRARFRCVRQAKPPTAAPLPPDPRLKLARNITLEECHRPAPDLRLPLRAGDASPAGGSPDPCRHGAIVDLHRGSDAVLDILRDRRLRASVRAATTVALACGAADSATLLGSAGATTPRS